jgi:hypothetical protein
MMVSSFFYTPLIAYSNTLIYAYIFHIIGILSFSLGYFYPKKRSGIYVNYFYKINSKYLFVSYFFALFGLVITLLQINQTTNPVSYFIQIITGNFSTDIREAFLLSSQDGGLNGIIRIFHTSTLAVLLINLSFLSTLKIDLKSKKSLILLVFISTFLLLLKIIYSLDRLSIIGLILGFIFYYRKHLFNIKIIVLFISLIFVAEFISSIRLLNFSILDFLVLYSRLGIVNFQLMIESINGFTFGFSTILAPLSFLFRGLGIQIQFPSSSYTWAWNSAQYLLSYSYQDFGLFFPIFIFLIGVFVGIVDYNSIKMKNPYITSIFLLISYTVVSFISVPVFRSVELYLMIIVAFVMTKLLRKYRLITKVN